MRVYTWASLLFAAASATIALQTPLGTGFSVGLREDNFKGATQIEVGDTDDVSTADKRSVRDQIVAANMMTGTHAVLTHPLIPRASIRIKRIHAARNTTGTQYDQADPEAFCDPGVTSWSGYIDTIDGKSLFFYFFESRNSPETDPVLLWMNGGPGCSSQLGLFMELGPCRITEESKSRSGPPINATEYNPHSWNDRANTIFIDQPAGVGYSYSRYGIEVGDTEAGAKDVYAFLRIFFAAFPEFHKTAHNAGFHLSGESYAGRYIPIFATEIVDRNGEFEYAAWRDGKKPNFKEIIPLKSIIIGNGITDVSVQLPKAYEFACTRNNGLGKPVVGIEQCARMAVYAKLCAKTLGKHCRDSYNSDRCWDALSVCRSELAGPVYATGRNPYDISDPCLAGMSPNLCYSITADIVSYLDRPDVRRLVGAEPPESIGAFQSCNMRVNELFSGHHDGTWNNKRNIALLLEQGVKALIYNGDLDFQCNGVGHRASVDTMEWSSQEQFLTLPLRPWLVDGQVAGQTRSVDGLTWATVYQASHMVPYSKPAESQALLNRWLAGEDL